jgi:hypothetical protein
MVGPQERFYPHPSRPEILEKVKGFLKQITGSKDYHDAFFGLNEYSDAELAKGGATSSGILVPSDKQTDSILNNQPPRK